MIDVATEKEFIQDAVLELERDVNALKYLAEQNHEQNATAIKIFDGLFTRLVELLWLGVIVNISWLFDCHGQRGLQWYIEQLSLEYPQRSLEIPSIDSLATDDYKLIRKFRDKWMVHRDSLVTKEFKAFWETRPSLIMAERFVKRAKDVIDFAEGPVVDATPGIGVNKLFNLVKVLERESPEFGRIVNKYAFTAEHTTRFQ